MTYVCAGIHGDYKKYKEALIKINLKDSDILYVLGNVIDYGEESMEILLDMMCRINVIPLAGTHEYMAVRLLPHLPKTMTPDFTLDPKYRSEFLAWQEQGGGSTMGGYFKLDKDSQEAVLDYLEEFDNFAELEVKGQDYILVHGGLGNFQEDKLLEDYSIEEILLEEPDYSKTYFEDTILVTASTPTYLIEDSGNVVYRKNNHLAIHCAGNEDGALAVVCLETGKEYYCYGE